MVVLILEECVSWEFLSNIKSFAVRFCDQALMLGIFL